MHCKPSLEYFCMHVTRSRRSLSSWPTLVSRYLQLQSIRRQTVCQLSRPRLSETSEQHSCRLTPTTTLISIFNMSFLHSRTPRPPCFTSGTSGTLIPLQHGITREDLNCSRELWEQSKLNRHRDRETSQPMGHGDDAFLNLHPEPPTDPSKPNRRERFNAWKFLHDLVNHGPPAVQEISEGFVKVEAQGCGCHSRE